MVCVLWFVLCVVCCGLWVVRGVWCVVCGGVVRCAVRATRCVVRAVWGVLRVMWVVCVAECFVVRCLYCVFVACCACCVLCVVV